MPLACQVIALIEHTPAWWAWRREGIGSADAATLMGERRAKSLEQLRDEKLQPPQPTARFFEQARSARHERQARELYGREMGCALQPACVQSLARPWQRASLDGLSADAERVVEIKCGHANYDAAAARQRPARHHFPQLQHILSVTGLPVIDYWCCAPHRAPLRIEVRRDDAYIARLLAAEEAFWLSLPRGAA